MEWKRAEPTNRFNRFLVFRHMNYYPSGGLGDVLDSFDSLEDAEKFATDVYGDDVYIYDRVFDVVWEQE